MSFVIPESLNEIIRDEPLRNGVFELVDRLDGKKMVASDWNQSRDYARALGMAALARSDFVVFMHDVWDETWGKARVLDLGKPEYDESCDPNYVWENEEIWSRTPYQLPQSGSFYSIFYVKFDFDKGIHLQVSFEDESYAGASGAAAYVGQKDGWESHIPKDMKHPFLKSEIIPLDDIGGGIDRLRLAAGSFVDALKN